MFGGVDAKVMTFLDGTVSVPESFFLEKVPCSPGDAVVVSGTIVEGIGNSESDFDVYVLTELLPKAFEFRDLSLVEVCGKDYRLLDCNSDCEVHSIYDYIGNNGLHLDVQYVLTSDIIALYDRIRLEYVAATDDNSIYYYTSGNASYDDGARLHRFCHAIPLTNSHKFLDIISSAPIDEWRYCLFLSRLPDYFKLKDVRGAWRSENLDMAREILREILVDHFLALTHACGNTNPNKKWVFSYGERFSKQIGSVYTDFCNLLSAETGSNAIREWIVSGINLIDEMFNVGRHLCIMNSTWPDAKYRMDILNDGLTRRGGCGKHLSNEAFNIKKRSITFCDDPLRLTILGIS